MMRARCSIALILLTAMTWGNAANGAAANGGDHSAYQWHSGTLIPNEFALPMGKWSNATVKECITKCSADTNCGGFSIKKKLGDAWENGCEGTICNQRTECHAKTQHKSKNFWLPTDRQIRVPEVDPKSNNWISNWGTIIKK